MLAGGPLRTGAKGVEKDDRHRFRLLAGHRPLVLELLHDRPIACVAGQVTGRSSRENSGHGGRRFALSPRASSATVGRGGFGRPEKIGRPPVTRPRFDDARREPGPLTKAPFWERAPGNVLQSFAPQLRELLGRSGLLAEWRAYARLGQGQHQKSPCASGGLFGLRGEFGVVDRLGECGASSGAYMDPWSRLGRSPQSEITSKPGWEDVPNKSEYASGARGVCQVCGRAGVAWFHVKRQVGMIFFRRVYVTDALLCRDHAISEVRSWLLRTLVQGWWGVVSFFTNFVVAGSDAVQLVKAHRMPRLTPPGPD